MPTTYYILDTVTNVKTENSASVISYTTIEFEVLSPLKYNKKHSFWLELDRITYKSYLTQLRILMQGIIKYNIIECTSVIRLSIFCVEHHTIVKYFINSNKIKYYILNPKSQRQINEIKSLKFDHHLLLTFFFTICNNTETSKK